MAKIVPFRQAGQAVRIAATLATLSTLAGCGGSLVSSDLTSPDALPCSTGHPATTDWRPGCATRRNLVAIAENPDDLFIPRSETPRDAMRRDAVIGGYMQSRADVSPSSAAPASPAGTPGSTQ
jgi:hypothetical protein